VCRLKPAEQFRHIGITNSTTQLHLVGSFYEHFVEFIFALQTANVAHFQRKIQLPGFSA